MPWNAELERFDPPSEWPITLEPEQEQERVPTLVPFDVAALGLCLLNLVTTFVLFVPWSRAPIATTLGLVAILFGCGVVRGVLERRRPDSGLVAALRRWGL